MKLMRRVGGIEVKRTFLLTEFLRKYGVAKKNDKKVPPVKKYLLARARAYRALRKLPEKKLDKIIGSWKKRLVAYQKVDWYVGELLTKEVGVWKRAGGLPASWTDNSLAHTGNMVRKALESGSGLLNKRARRVVPIIINLKKIIKKDRYSLPIVIERGPSPVNRKGLKKMRWELDDGNMRSIAFAVSGDRKIRAYIGVKKS